MGMKWWSALVVSEADALESTIALSVPLAQKLDVNPRLSMIARPAEPFSLRLWSVNFAPWAGVANPPENLTVKPTVRQNDRQLLDSICNEFLLGIPEFHLAQFFSTKLGKAYYHVRVETVGLAGFVCFSKGNIQSGEIVSHGEGCSISLTSRRSVVRLLTDESSEQEPDCDGFKALTGGVLDGINDANAFDNNFRLEWVFREKGFWLDSPRLKKHEPLSLGVESPRRRKRPLRLKSHRKEWLDRFHRDEKESRSLARDRFAIDPETHLWFGLEILYANEDLELAAMYFKRIANKLKRKLPKALRARRPSANSSGDALGLLIRCKVYANALLGQPLDFDLLRLASTDYYQRAISHGSWSSLEEGWFLTAARLALIIGDLELFNDLVPRKRHFSSGLEEQTLLSNIAADTEDATLERAFVRYFNKLRRPRLLPPSHSDHFAPLELACIFDRYFFEPYGSMEMQRVVSHIAGETCHLPMAQE